MADPTREEIEKLDARQIELIRACLDDGTYTATEQKDFGMLCDLALRALSGKLIDDYGLRTAVLEEAAQMLDARCKSTSANAVRALKSAAPAKRDPRSISTEEARQGIDNQGNRRTAPASAPYKSVAGGGRLTYDKATRTIKDSDGIVRLQLGDGDADMFCQPASAQPLYTTGPHSLVAQGGPSEIKSLVAAATAQPTSAVPQVVWRNFVVEILGYIDGKGMSLGPNFRPRIDAALAASPAPEQRE